jgi:hypothetical protein
MGLNCLSLFDYSGNWSEPWKATHRVYQVDIKLGIDILELTTNDLPSSFDVILAALLVQISQHPAHSTGLRKTLMVERRKA